MPLTAEERRNEIEKFCHFLTSLTFQHKMLWMETGGVFHTEVGAYEISLWITNPSTTPVYNVVVAFGVTTRKYSDTKPSESLLYLFDLAKTEANANVKSLQDFMEAMRV